MTSEKRIKAELKRIKAMLEKPRRGDDFITLLMMEQALMWALNPDYITPLGNFEAMQKMRAAAEEVAP